MVEDVSIYANNPNHPIPDLDVCDVTSVLKSGGEKLSIVVASPMKNDLYSRSRLIEKIGRYLGYLRSATFEEKYGKPTPENAIIIVHIHPDSDTGIFQLLKECIPWAEDNDVRLEIKKRG